MPITQQMLRDGLRAPPDYDNARCQKCKYYQQSHVPFVKPLIKSPIIFVLGAPSLYDYGIVGEGYEWRMISDLMRDIGLGHLNLSWVTATRCLPVKKKTVGKGAIEMCTPFMFHDLNVLVAPEERKLIAMGADSMHALVGHTMKMKDALGRVFETPHGKTLVTYSVREYFHEVKKDKVLQVGVLEVIKKHIVNFIEERQWVEFPKYEEIL